WLLGAPLWAVNVVDVKLDVMVSVHPGPASGSGEVDVLVVVVTVSHVVMLFENMQLVVVVEPSAAADDAPSASTPPTAPAPLIAPIAPMARLDHPLSQDTQRPSMTVARTPVQEFVTVPQTEDSDCPVGRAAGPCYRICADWRARVSRGRPPGSGPIPSPSRC